MRNGTPKRGRKQESGLRWHRQKGWYRLFDGKPKYFGGAGKPETSEARKSDRTIRANAEQSWLDYEREQHLAPLVRDYRRQAGFSTGYADAVVMLSEHIETERIAELAARLRFPGQSPTPQAPQAPIGAPTCQDVLDAYLAYLRAHDKSQGHINDTNRAFTLWNEYIGGADTPIASLTRETFSQYRDKWHTRATARKKWVAEQKRKGTILTPGEMRQGDGCSPSYANKNLRIIQDAFRRAHKETGITAPDLPEYITLLEQTSLLATDRAIFTPDELTALLAVTDVQWKARVLITLNCGLSNQDVSDLFWGHITDKGILDFARGKNQRIRRIPLWDRTIQALHDWRAHSQTDRCFTTRNAKPLVQFSENGSPKDALGQEYKKLNDSLGQKHTWGTLRKSTATVAKITGATDATISMLLGDAPNSVWKKYAMMVPETVSTAVKGIETYYFPD